MQDAHDLNLVIEAGIPLVALETWDEPRAIDLLRLARSAIAACFSDRSPTASNAGALACK